MDMAGYSKMDIMSMSEEEIKKALEEEGRDLPEHTIYFMVEELKRREQFEEAVLTVDDEYPEDEESSEESEEAEKTSEDEVAEEPQAEETGEEPELTEEELEAQKKEEDRMLIEEYQKSRKKTLRFALIGAGVAAIAVTAFILYLYGSGALS